MSPKKKVADRKYFDNQKFMNGFAGFSAPFIFLSLSLLFSVGLTIAIDKNIINVSPDDIPVSLSLVLTQLVILFTTIFIFFISGVYREGRERVKEIFRFQNFKYSSVLLGFGIGILMLIAFIIINSVISSMGLYTDGGSDTTEEVLSAVGAFNVLVTVLSVSLINPILEEVFARGAIMGLIENAGGKWFRVVAVIFSSAFFSLLHFQGLSDFNDLRILLTPFVSALIFSFVAIKSRSIYPAIAAHVSYNSAILAIGYL